MNNPLRLLLFIFLFMFTACSSVSLQGKRLNTAEGFIIEAEQILNQAHSKNQLNIATESLGTANAYLLTLQDHQKFLSKDEYRYYQSLNNRANKLKKMLSAAKN